MDGARTSSGASAAPLTRRGWALLQLIAASATWGLSVTFTKLGVDRVAAVPLLLIELAAAALALWGAVLLIGGPGRVKVRDAVALGALEPALAYLFITSGLERTSGANGSILTGLESCFAVLLAAIVLKERLNSGQALAVALALAGLLLVGAAGSPTQTGWGDLLVVGGVLCAAGYVVVAKLLASDADTLTLTAYQFTCALAIVSVFSLALSGTSDFAAVLKVPPEYVLLAAATGVIGFGVSFLLYNAASSYVTAGTAATILTLIPLFGVAGAVIVLGEPLTARTTLGGVLVGFALVMFTRQEARGVDAYEDNSHGPRGRLPP